MNPINIIRIIFCIILFSANIVYGAGSPNIKVDGFKEIVNVWHDKNSKTGFLEIIACYGTSNPSSTIISDPFLVHASSPILAASHSSSAITTAVAVWRGYDLISGNHVIQAAIADTSGWTANSAVTISDAVKEIPQNEYSVDISNDGKVIGIIWTSYLISSGCTVIRRVISTDGGANFTNPITL